MQANFDQVKTALNARLCVSHIKNDHKCNALITNKFQTSSIINACMAFKKLIKCQKIHSSYTHPTQQNGFLVPKKYNT